MPEELCIARLVAVCHSSVGGAESPQGAVEVLAVFDHDWQQHLLVQEWDRTDPEPRWVYRLWFRDGDLVVPVASYPTARWPSPPLVEAARDVSDWRELAARSSRPGEFL